MNSTNFYQISISGSIYDILNGPSALPVTFYNTSNFDNLELSDPSLLTGLNWMGHPEVGFWSGIDTNSIPEHDFTQNLNSSTELVPESGLVKVTYFLTERSDLEISGSVNSWQNQIRQTRDQYLQMTDFTQLSDVPISTGFKEEYRVFRQELREMFDDVGPTGTGLVWPDMPTGVPNIDLPPLPPFPPLV